MALEVAHIELANKNHDALADLLNSGGDHPEWVVTMAFYKALQILEGIFAGIPSIGHDCGHRMRAKHLNNARFNLRPIQKAYKGLYEASVNARYHPESFPSYISQGGAEKILKKRLRVFEQNSLQFLSQSARNNLKRIDTIIGT